MKMDSNLGANALYWCDFKFICSNFPHSWKKQLIVPKLLVYNVLNISSSEKADYLAKSLIFAGVA